MSRLFFTGDTHFGHNNIIKFCKRPFSSCGEMNETLIRVWNDTVGPNDVIYHLGDVSFRGNHPSKYLSRLNGQIHVLFGNHDKEREIEECLRDGVIRWCGHVKLIRWNKNKFFLSHYAHRTWPSSHHGTLHLYGHSHNTLSNLGRSMDVGVDAQGFAPIAAERVYSTLVKDTSMIL